MVVATLMVVAKRRLYEARHGAASRCAARHGMAPDGQEPQVPVMDEDLADAIDQWDRFLAENMDYL